MKEKKMSLEVKERGGPYRRQAMKRQKREEKREGLAGISTSNS